MRLAVLVPALALAAMPPASPAVQRILGSQPADSLVAPLARYEATHRGTEAEQAAFALGQLRYARGEYRQAAEAFQRATPRFGAPGRVEPRYWAGLAWLGAGEPAQARAAFDEATRSGSPRRPEALLGVALCWEVEQRSERAVETLQTLLAGDAGEAGPAALERLTALAGRLGRSELARRSRERLAHDYPGSVEAARAGRAPAVAAAPRPTPAPAGPAKPRPTPARVSPPPPGAVQGPLAVQIGAFRDAGLAGELVARARKAGFHPVRLSSSQDAGGAIYAVRVGVYATAEDARAAGIRLGRALGVAWRVVAAP